MPAHPLRVELGAGLTRSAPLGTKELLYIKGCVSFEHTIDRPCKFVSQETQRFAFIMLFLQPGQILLSRFVPAQEQRGRFRKGPCEVRVANLVPRRAQAFAPRFFGTLDKTTRRREILPPWEALNVMDFVEQDETEDFSNTWHRLSEVQRLGIVLFGCFEHKEFEIAEHLVILGEQCEGACHSFLASWSIEPLGDAVPIGFIGDLLADLGPVVLAVGMLDMRQEFRAFAHQGRAAAQHITGRAHRCRIDIGLGQHAAAE